MSGPSGVIALVLAEIAAGSAAFLWLTGLWGNVKRGFFVLTGSTIALCAVLAAFATRSASSGSAAADLAVTVSMVAAALATLSLVLLLVRAAAGAGRWVGIAAMLAAVAQLVAYARLADASFAVALLQLLAGAAFMGAVTNGLLLGHWYLVDRGLSRSHIRRLALVLVASVGAEAAAVLLGGFGSRGVSPGFSLILTAAGLAPFLALGMIACTGLLAVLIRGTLKGEHARAVQAATGFFYLAVITAFAAEMAAKVRFAA